MKAISDLVLAQNERAAIEAAARLLREHFPVEHVVLFGSKARGTGDAESDIDLLLLTRWKLGWREQDEITNALFDIELAHNVVISTLIVPTEEWTNGVFRVLPIHDEIVRDGVAARPTKKHAGS